MIPSKNHRDRDWIPQDRNSISKKRLRLHLLYLIWSLWPIHCDLIKEEAMNRYRFFFRSHVPLYKVLPFLLLLPLQKSTWGLQRHREQSSPFSHLSYDLDNIDIDSLFRCLFFHLSISVDIPSSLLSLFLFNTFSSYSPSEINTARGYLPWRSSPAPPSSIHH